MIQTSTDGRTEAASLGSRPLGVEEVMRLADELAAEFENMPQAILCPARVAGILERSAAPPGCPAGISGIPIWIYYSKADRIMQWEEMRRRFRKILEVVIEE